jgi:hypothetical protein
MTRAVLMGTATVLVAVFAVLSGGGVAVAADCPYPGNNCPPPGSSTTVFTSTTAHVTTTTKHTTTTSRHSTTTTSSSGGLANTSGGLANTGSDAVILVLVAVGLIVLGLSVGRMARVRQRR